MRQPTLASQGFEKYRMKTRKQQFLDEMEQVVPWQELVALIQPHYPAPQGAGRRPVGIERMLRIYFLQHWYGLSDPAVEEALYDVPAMREFAGIDLGRERAPDETTVCKFRHLLEAHGLCGKIFESVNAYLSRHGRQVKRGTIVDATIIRAPSSTKNQSKSRDPEMHSTRKGNQWHFGMKAHVGVDSDTKLIHSVEATAANVHDSQVIGKLLHGGETRVWGDSAYTGHTEVIQACAPIAEDLTNKKGSRNAKLSDVERANNRRKSKVRARVEHVFGVMKGQFGFRKVRYKGLSKNMSHLQVSCALVNLALSRNHLLAQRRML